MPFPPASSRPRPRTVMCPLTSILAVSRAIRQGAPPGWTPRTTLGAGAPAAIPETGSTAMPSSKLSSESSALPGDTTSAAKNNPRVQVFMDDPPSEMKEAVAYAPARSKSRDPASYCRTLHSAQTVLPGSSQRRLRRTRGPGPRGSSAPGTTGFAPNECALNRISVEISACSRAASRIALCKPAASMRRIRSAALRASSALRRSVSAMRRALSRVCRISSAAFRAISAATRALSALCRASSARPRVLSAARRSRSAAERFLSAARRSSSALARTASSCKCRSRAVLRRAAPLAIGWRRRDERIPGSLTQTDGPAYRLDQLWRIVPDALLEDELRLLDVLDLLRRIPLDQHQVGELAWRDGADPLRLHRREARLDQELHPALIAEASQGAAVAGRIAAGQEGPAGGDERALELHLQLQQLLPVRRVLGGLRVAELVLQIQRARIRSHGFQRARLRAARRVEQLEHGQRGGDRHLALHQLGDELADLWRPHTHARQVGGRCARRWTFVRLLPRKELRVHHQAVLQVVDAQLRRLAKPD